MKPVIFTLYEDNSLLKFVANQNNYETGEVILHDFPDGETYIRFKTSLKEREVIILNSLDRPNSKILPLLFAAKTAKKIGAKRVGLCAPYLAYMRQDKAFHSGEGITSNHFASMLSQHVDWLVTVDPHLHRYHNLNELYSIPNTVLHATHAISDWIAHVVHDPIIIGPDEESEQWVSEIAKDAKAPYLILEKIRHGDRDVTVSKPILGNYINHTPVLVDDIISTAHTLIETLNHLKKFNIKPPICIGIHAIFADKAYESLQKAGAAQIVTCNTITHRSNHIDLSALIATGIQQQLSKNQV